MAYRAAVVGGSGYTGAELLRLLAGHPEIEVVQVTAESNEGAAVRDLYPSLAPAYPGMTYASLVTAELAGLDLVFLALPHGESQQVAGSWSTPSVTSSTSAPTSACRGGLRAVVRRGPRRARTARAVRVRAARALPRRHRRGAPRRRARLLPDRGQRSRSRRSCATGWSSRPASSSTRCRACRARAAA